ncbi:putative choline transporter, neither null mutation nor overexpression affects choline transport [Chytridiales sp. JEL 0842]|nr:putative choline transporter, neither null mutation nor overexpression affects choline transport [Chytridiales sp. JEL 0842]
MEVTASELYRYTHSFSHSPSASASPLPSASNGNQATAATATATRSNSNSRHLRKGKEDPTSSSPFLQKDPELHSFLQYAYHPAVIEDVLDSIHPTSSHHHASPIQIPTASTQNHHPHPSREDSSLPTLASPTSESPVSPTDTAAGYQQQNPPYGSQTGYQQQQQYPPPGQEYIQSTQPAPQYAPNTTYNGGYGAPSYPPPQPDPKYYEVPVSSGTAPKIVEKPKVQDVWAIFLFLLFVAGFAVLAAIGIPQAITLFTRLNNNTNSVGPASTRTSSSTDTLSIPISTRDIGGLIGSAVGSGLVFSIIWFLLMLKFAGTMIHISYFLTFLIMVASTVYFAFIRQFVAAVIWAIFAVLFIVSYWWIRHKIPFAKVILKTVTRIVTKFSGTIVAAFIGLIISAAFSVTWMASAIGMLDYVSVKGGGRGAFIAILVLMLFMLYWINEVIRNVVHVTVSGTFATFYFMGVQTPGSTAVTVPVKAVTARSAGRAMTTSFGSICFGSLLIAIIATLKALASYARGEAAQNGNIVACLLASCLQCILSCIEDILDYFNKYAFTQVAIYGKGYCQAAKDTWQLAKSRGFEALLNDTLIGNVLGVGAVAAALVAAFCGWLYVRFSNSISQDVGVYVAVCIISALIGMWLFYILTEVISSGVATTFVCLCEDPATLQRQQPELFAKIQATWPEISFGVNTQAYYA